MVKIGKLTLDAPFYQAGLAGYSDTAMRLIARRHGAPYAVTEALLDLFLINGGRGLANAELDPLDHPIAGQIMGSEPVGMAQAAKILVGMGYDVIDVNLACPVKKIRKRCRGGHLLTAPDEAIAILDAVRQVVPDHVPTSVKLRRGYDDSPEAEANFHTIFQAVLKLGYASATIHGRTVEQKYIGPSRWAFLSDLTKTYQSATDAGFTIMGSGDIWNAMDVFRMIQQTGVQGVSVARGCIGNPWLFTQARAIMAGDTLAATTPPTIFQQRAVLLEHFDLSLRIHGERNAGMMMRKFGIRFSRHHPMGKEVAKEFISVHSLGDWQRAIEKHYALDGPGVISRALGEPGGSESQAEAEEETCDTAATD